MPVRIITEPAGEPVTLAEAKAHLRVDASDEDALISALIVAARQAVEERTGRSLMTRTLRLTLDAFSADVIELPRPPVVAVSSVSYVDTAGDTQTWPDDQYQVDVVSAPGRLMPAYGACWPSTRAQANAVSVTYSAGYGEAADVPQAVRHAILLLVAHWYELRTPVNVGNIVNDLPMTVQYLLDPYRVWTIA